MLKELTIQDLISELSPSNVSGERSGRITGIAYDSRMVKVGHAFFDFFGQKK